jgi:hypothetical protein
MRSMSNSSMRSCFWLFCGTPSTTIAIGESALLICATPRTETKLLPIVNDSS